MKKSTIAEVVYITIFFLILAAGFVLTIGFLWGFLLGVGIAAGFGVVEFVCWKITGSTLSQKALVRYRENPLRSWIGLFLFFIFAAMLYAHFHWDIPGRFF